MALRLRPPLANGVPPRPPSDPIGPTGRAGRSQRQIEAIFDAHVAQSVQDSSQRASAGILEHPRCRIAGKHPENPAESTWGGGGREGGEEGPRRHFHYQRIQIFQFLNWRIYFDVYFFFPFFSIAFFFSIFLPFKKKEEEKCRVASRALGRRKRLRQQRRRSAQKFDNNQFLKRLKCERPRKKERWKKKNHQNPFFSPPPI